MAYSQESVADEIQVLIEKGILSKPEEEEEEEEEHWEPVRYINHGPHSSKYKENDLNKSKVLSAHWLNEDGIPFYWDKARLPDPSSENIYELVSLSPTDHEYKTIVEEFDAVDIDVVSVKRIQNICLLDKFKGEIEHVKKMRPKDFDVNIHYLYHGSDVATDVLCGEGLDARLSQMGCFGKGLYFSDTPIKCLQYTSNQDENPYILKCRVILGDVKIYLDGATDLNLKREPKKKSGNWKFYDSVQGKPNDLTEFVVYDNRRAMVEYIIYFNDRHHRTRDLVSPSRKCKSSGKATPPDDPWLKKVEDVVDNCTFDIEFEDDTEVHLRSIEKIRFEMRRQKALERGETPLEPTEEQVRKDRHTWCQLMKFNGVDLSKVIKRKDKDERTKTAVCSESDAAKEQNFSPKKANERYGGTYSAEEEDAIGAVLSNQIVQFLNITQTDSIDEARYFLGLCNGEISHALILFYEGTSS